MAFVEVHNLSVDYRCKSNSAMFTKAESFRAVDNVSFSINQGETLGIVGESGSGKSSLVRGLLGLIPISTGSMRQNNVELASLDAQLVFQDPLASLDPRFNIARCISEPLELRGCSRTEIEKRLYEMMDEVGLDKALANRYPHEFSGGQCQRVGIARALIAQPQVLICDEPVSALDVSIRAQILNLLKRLQNDYNLTMIFIAHDIGVVKLMSHEIMVMYQGEVVECGEAKLVYEHARHPYTQQLIQSQLQADPQLAREQLLNKKYDYSSYNSDNIK